ncbi:MAG: hypothetical protein ACK4M2_04230 [Brevundimonas sp.]
MITEDKFKEALATARSHLAKIAPYLPLKVSADEIGVWSKAPYKALVVRGGLLWRSQELGADAIQAFAEGRLATAIILTRAVIENVALHWRLGDLIERRGETTPNELSDTLTRMLVGWKNDKEFPEALNALTMIGHLDKHIPGVRASYDQLSEVAHPNYGGVHGLYAENDEANFITNLGPKVRTTTPRHSVLILSASLGIQINADVRFSEAIKEWIHSLPSLDNPRPDDEEWWVANPPSK